MANPDVLEKPVKEKDVFIEDKVEFAKPKNWRILLINNTETHHEGVVDLLYEVFRKQRYESHQIMIKAHNEGEALVEITSKEIAELKLTQVHNYIEEQEQKRPNYRMMGFQRPYFWRHLQFRIEEDQA